MRTILQGERMPFGYGIVYRDWAADGYKIAPIPLNWIIVLALNFWHFFMKPPITKIDQIVWDQTRKIREQEKKYYELRIQTELKLYREVLNETEGEGRG